MTLSHRHIDHVNGAVHTLALMNWYYKSSSIDVYFPDPEIHAAFRSFLDFFEPLDTERIRLRDYAPGTVFEDENLRVTALPNLHLVKGNLSNQRVLEQSIPSYSLLIEGEGKRILYTGDLHHSYCDFPQMAFAEHTDMIITEFAHGTYEVMREIGHKADTDRFVINHIYPLDKMEKIQAEPDYYRGQVSISKDGDIYLF